MTRAPATEDRIVHAALSLIAEEGLGSVTMLRIAEVAGVARQTLYNHYPDVESIVVESIGRHNRESIRLLESSLAVVEGPEDKIEQLVRHVVSIGANAHHSPGIEHALSADARATLGEYDDALNYRLGEILDEGKSGGNFRRDLDMDIDVELIRRMLDGLLEQAAAAPASAATIASAGTRTILAAICSI